MEKKWSKFWKASVQTRKQRKYVYNAPLHIKHKLMGSSLSKDIRKELGIRSAPVRVGDQVKVITGQFKGKIGKVTKVSVSRMYAHIEGATIHRADGTESFYPIHPSNLVILKLDMNDKLRTSKLERAKAK